MQSWYDFKNSHHEEEALREWARKIRDGAEIHISFLYEERINTLVQWIISPPIVVSGRRRALTRG